MFERKRNLGHSRSGFAYGDKIFDSAGGQERQTLVEAKDFFNNEPRYLIDEAVSI